MSKPQGLRVPTVTQLQRDPESVPEDSKLIILANPAPGHKIWENTLGSYEESGSLHFESFDAVDVCIPPSNLPNLRVTASRGPHSTQSTVETTVSIQGRKLNPTIRAVTSIYRGNGNSRRIVFSTQVDWPFAPIKWRGNTNRKCGVTDLTARIDSSNEFLELNFVPECAISVNLLPVTYNSSLLELTDNEALTPAEFSLLLDFAEMVEHPQGRCLSVRFNIGPQERDLLAVGDTETAHSQLLDILPTKNNLADDFRRPRWSQYRKEDELLSDASSSADMSDNLSDPFANSVRSSPTPPPLSMSAIDSSISEPMPSPPLQVSFNTMKSRHEVLSRPHPGTPIPAVKVFHDQDDALVSLAYGAHLECEEQNTTFAAMKRDLHRVRICAVDTRVLALVEFSTPPDTGLPQDRFRLDDSTKVDLTIGGDATGKNAIIGSGMTVANVFGLPRSDLLILVENKWSSAFRNCSQPIEHFQKEAGVRAPYLSVRVSPQLNNHSFKTEVDAVMRAYGPGCPTDRLPFLLGDGSSLGYNNPLANVGHVAKAAFQELKGAKSWNEEQMQVIDTIPTAPAGVMMVLGPGGTGKTALVTHVVKLAARIGQYALVSGTRNDTVDDMTVKINELDPALRPVRYYSPSQEKLGSLYEGNKGSVMPGSSNSLLVSTFDTIEGETKKARRSLPEFSVLGWVLKNLDRQKPLMRSFRPKDRSAGKRPQEDVRAYFRDRLHLLRTNLYGWNLPWVNGDEEKDFLDQAYTFLRAEVIREARVMLITNHMADKAEIQLYFAWPDKPGKIWLFQDEAQSMTEAASLVPFCLHDVSNTGQETRTIIMHFICGDLKQLPPFTMSRTGRFNTVNEFAAQRAISLMERKLASNFPAITLVEQRRAASVLMRGANMFHYGGKLRTPDYPPLDAEYMDLIPELAGFKMRPYNHEDKRRLAWIEVDSEAYESEATGSRANPKNALVVRDILVKVQAKFGKRTSKKCKLCTPYKRQKELFVSIGCELKANFGWTDADLPSIHTCDSLIGRESSLVILDLVNNGTEGFLRDCRRACVTFTRSKDMFLVIGGKFTLPDYTKQINPKVLVDPVTGHRINADMSRPLAFYHAFFKANGFMYPAGMSAIPEPVVPSDLRPLGHDMEDEEAGKLYAVSGEEDIGDWELVM